MLEKTNYFWVQLIVSKIGGEVEQPHGFRTCSSVCGQLFLGWILWFIRLYPSTLDISRILKCPFQNATQVETLWSTLFPFSVRCFLNCFLVMDYLVESRLIINSVSFGAHNFLFFILGIVIVHRRRIWFA